MPDNVFKPTFRIFTRRLSMENKIISRRLRLLSQLMELHEVNPFKIKSIANAAFKVDKLPFPIASKGFDELEKIDGIGKSLAAKIAELLRSRLLFRRYSSYA